MKIAIISDVHNNEVNLKKVLDYCARENIRTIICCGDLASKETLDFLCDNFEGAIHYTFGNMDNDQLKNEICHPERSEGSRANTASPNSTGFLDKLGMTCNYKNAKIYKNFGKTEIENKKIAFVHFPDIAKELCQSRKYDFVFYGHTHTPWEENINGCKMLNPGNVAGEIYPPTFAVWNTEDGKFELIRVHNLN